MFKRVGLYLLTNLAVLTVLGLVLAFLRTMGWLPEEGTGGLLPMLIIAAVWGFGGSIISLLMSKSVARWTTRARVIEQPQTETERWLVETVRAQATQAGIGMPDVAIYESPDPNAFATGARRNHALVAVSRGLLQAMSRDEVEAVLGHEVSHVANGDMVTLTLIQGVLNTFVIFLSRIIGQIVDRAVFRSRDGYGLGYFVSVMVTQVVLGIVATMVVMWFSRRREFRADQGGAALSGAPKMEAALRRLQQLHQPADLPESMRAMGIRGGGGSAIKALFSSHPPLETRIARLRQNSVLS